MRIRLLSFIPKGHKFRLSRQAAQLSFMLLAGFFCTSAQAAAKIEHWQTAQGSRVYYVHTEGLPMVDIQVAFDAGSARDGYQFGLSALTSGRYRGRAVECRSNRPTL